MPYDGSSWNESEPTNSTLANEIDDVARDMKIAVRSRLAQEHVWSSSQTGTGEAGFHKTISFQAQTGTPAIPVVSSVTQAGMLFMTSGNLVFQNSAGTTFTVLASGGFLNVTGALYSATGTQGDMLIGTSGGNLKVLAASATNYVMVTRSGTADPIWSAPSSVGNSIGVSIVNYGGSLTTGSAQNLSGLKIVYGLTPAIGANSSTAITNLPFADGTSYRLVANHVTTDVGFGSGPLVVQTNGSTATIYNPEATVSTINWVAIGQ